MNLLDTIVENVYQFITQLEKDSYRKPEIVMIINPKGYHELRTLNDEKFIYKKTINDIEKVNIIGIDIPVIISDELPNNVIYQLMTRQDYERLEKEKLYHKFMEMFN